MRLLIHRVSAPVSCIAEYSLNVFINMYAIYCAIVVVGIAWHQFNRISVFFFFAQWKLSLKEGQKLLISFFYSISMLWTKFLSRFKYFLKISYYFCKRHIPFFFFFFFLCFSRKSLKKSFSFVVVLLSFIYIYFNLFINSFIIFNDLDCDLLTTLYSRTSFIVFLLRTQAKNGLSFYHSLHI